MSLAMMWNDLLWSPRAVDGGLANACRRQLAGIRTADRVASAMSRGVAGAARTARSPGRRRALVAHRYRSPTEIRKGPAFFQPGICTVASRHRILSQVLRTLDRRLRDCESVCKNLQAVPEQASTSGCERPRCGTADPDFPGSAAISCDSSRPSKPRVAGSSPAGRAIFSRSIPGTWVTVHSGEIGNTFGRTDSRSVRAGTSHRRSNPDRTA